MRSGTCDRRKCRRRPGMRSATPTSSKPMFSSASDRKSTRLNSSHLVISYAVFCLKKKKPRHVDVIGSNRRTDRRPFYDSTLRGPVRLFSRVMTRLLRVLWYTLLHCVIYLERYHHI